MVNKAVRNRTPFVTRVTISSMLITGAFAGSAYGQEGNNAQANPERSERFQVTGSHIKRIDIEGPSPISVLDRDYLDRSGGTSVADVLRENNVSSFGGFKEQAGSNAAGVAHVNLRGLGSTRTLVLLNGRRLPSDAVTGAADLNLIPIAAVERIEILKDGASAIYGSDALGGVVNIITRSNYSGAELSYKYYQPELAGGAKKEMSMIGGAATARTSITTVLNYRHSEMVYDRDRKWSKEGISLLGSPGTYQSLGEGGQNMPDPNCPEDRITAGPGGSYCSYDFAPNKSMLPEIENVGTLTSLRHSITDDLDFFARIGATRSRVRWVYAPSPGIFDVPASVAATLGADGGPLPGADPESDVRMRYRLVELGNRVSEVETTSFNGLFGLSGSIAHLWDWELAVQENRIKRMDIGTQGYAVSSTLESMIESGEFNPLGKEGERGDLSKSKFEPWEEAVTEVKQIDAKISGELFAMGGGHAALAFGAVASQEMFTDRLDSLSESGQAFGSAGSSGGGKRQTTSIYSELALPVSTELELQIAARHDEYSDFGSSTNPKFAMRYQPIPALMLRASVGTGFKAPSLVDLYAATSDGNPFFIDAVACENERQAGSENTPSCHEYQYRVVSSGNENLKEERSFSYNLGALYEPVSRISLGLDYWNIKLDNVVGIDYGDMTKAELAGIDVASHGVIIERDQTGNIEKVTAPLQNLASRKVSGLDLALNITLDSSRQVRLGIDHSHVFEYKEEGFPGSGFVNKLGDAGLPHWRNTVSLGYFPANHEMSVAARSIGGQRMEIAEQGNLASYTEVDLHYGFSGSWQGKLMVGVKNALGTTPPLDESTPNSKVNQNLYDQLGRVFYAGYSQTL